MALLKPKSIIPVTKTKRPRKISLWIEQALAIIAALNLCLVVFDLSYVSMRNFWLQGRVRFIDMNIGAFTYRFPEEPVTIFSLPVADWYDWVKGIEPYRDTEAYLADFENFKETLILYNLDSPEVEKTLAILREKSDEMIDTNPFQVANKTGTLERIKNIMRDHIGDDSAKESFQTFWSLSYLKSRNVNEELRFFERKIQPLIETNFFRPVGENGEPVDNFGLIDFPFTALFLVEFLGRTWVISRRRKGVSWLDAMLWRWYDVILFIPIPHWMNMVRLLRAVPTLIRLHQSHLVDMIKIKRQISQGFVASIAEDLTEVVVVSLLNQVQGSVKRGELTDFLAQQQKNSYIDLNNTNEIAEIIRLVAQVTINQVLPATRQDLEALMDYGIRKAIADVPAAQQMQRLPGVMQMQETITKQVIHHLYDVIYSQLQQLLTVDPEFDALIEQLAETFTNSMRNEIQAQQSIDRVEYLLIALIDEIKVNYVQRLSQEDVEDLMDQTRMLRQAAQTEVS
ncbi:hypothetical protein [Spirulina sp. CCNP1310]|uniref:hypothetical protein n=1 Tax=Spirulina sp. CCNP1310 TaxID=3110249 RepID=UPI002B2037D2|nr:hypothetical protein [Spirulina sp. CCNP1310]